MFADTLILLMLRKKIQLIKFEDLIGFIQQLLKLAASHLTSRGELQGGI